MTDKELLKLAAKAMGSDLWTDIDGNNYSEDSNGNEITWNPLADDGDALRLSVKLQISIANEHVNSGVAYCFTGEFDVLSEERSGKSESEVIAEDYAATRRAIVRAAAEIGKAMQ